MKRKMPRSNTTLMTLGLLTFPIVMACLYRWFRSRKNQDVKNVQIKDNSIGNNQRRDAVIEEAKAVEDTHEIGKPVVEEKVVCESHISKYVNAPPPAEKTTSPSNHGFFYKDTVIEEATAVEDTHAIGKPVVEEIFTSERSVSNYLNAQPFAKKTSSSNPDQKETTRYANSETSPSSLGLDFPFLVDPKTRAYIDKPESKTLFIMRGLSGSGKSTIVNVIQSTFQNVVICSADNFFCQSDGTYAFDVSKLGMAHEQCQCECKEACGRGTSVVVIDNTNVKRWEMKFYLEIAKVYGYVVLLVEPKTSWKFNPKELCKRNKHGVPLEALEKKVNSFDDVIPLYYGWFLYSSISSRLEDLADSIFKECLKVFPDFKRKLFQEYAANHLADDEESVEEMTSNFYSFANKTTPLLHCTSHFCNYGRIPDAKAYHQRKDVQSSYGQVHSLTISGLTMTRKTLGARVTLDNGCKALYTRPEEETWKGLENYDNDYKVMKKKKDKSKDRSKVHKKKGSSPALEVNLNHTTEMAEETDAIHLRELFPRLRNSGHARSAHITLKTAKGVESKETNVDVLNICDIEEKSAFFNRNEFNQIQKGLAYYHGNGICCVYFDKPIIIKAMFSGFYSR